MNRKIDSPFGSVEFIAGMGAGKTIATVNQSILAFQKQHPGRQVIAIVKNCFSVYKKVALPPKRKDLTYSISDRAFIDTRNGQTLSDREVTEAMDFWGDNWNE